MVVLLVCGVLFVGSLAFLIYERNQYNVVSHAELLTIREKLKVLTPQEKEDLAFFIGQVVSFDQYSYTLVGYKPMSICGVIIDDSEDLLTFRREEFKTRRNQALKRGYLVWKKYQSLFPRKKYVLVDYSFLGKGRREIALICPNPCIATIQEHLGDFRQVLEKPCSSQEVFWILTHPKHRDFSTIINHTRLVGILLGFGKGNACLYEQYRGGASRSVTWNPQLQQDPLKMFSNEWPWPGRQLSPDFACDPTTEETKQLKKHYKNARRIVRWTYFLRNNLEVTLALLIQS